MQQMLFLNSTCQGEPDTTRPPGSFEQRCGPNGVCRGSRRSVTAASGACHRSSDSVSRGASRATLGHLGRVRAEVVVLWSRVPFRRSSPSLSEPTTPNCKTKWTPDRTAVTLVSSSGMPAAVIVSRINRCDALFASQANLQPAASLAESLAMMAKCIAGQFGNLAALNIDVAAAVNIAIASNRLGEDHKRLLGEAAACEALRLKPSLRVRAPRPSSRWGTASPQGTGASSNPWTTFR